MKRYFKWLLLLAGVLGILLTIPFIWRVWLIASYSDSIYTPEVTPSERVAIVFGAQIYSNGRLSAMLQDRVDTAIELYQTGKVDKLLMSGDNRFEDYNEPASMMAYAIEHGVPAEDIQPDYAGRRTYDTCYRAKAIFQLKSAVLVTQNFHLPRALYTCHHLGVEGVGVIADNQRYRRSILVWLHLREVGATLLALLDVIQHNPAPVLGEPIVI